VVDAEDTQPAQRSINYVLAEYIPSSEWGAQQPRSGVVPAEPFRGKASRTFLAPGPTCDSYNCTDVHCVSALPNFCSSFDDQPS